MNALVSTLPPELDFSPTEQQILRRLLDPNSSIETLIPETVDREILFEQLRIAIKAVGYAEQVGHRLRPIIGRMLAIIENNPESYQKLGYNTFADFMRRGVESMGLCRSNAYDAKRMAEKFPTLSPERYAKIGHTNMKVLAKFTSEEDPKCEVYLKKGETSSINELREWAETKGHINKGEATPASIVIYTSAEVAEFWKEFISDPRVQAHCGSDKPGAILAMLIEEYTVEFMHDGERKLKTARPESGRKEART